MFDSEPTGGARVITSQDAEVGQQIKRRRAVLGLTQWQLAEQIGISFQQLHKYEAGTNRIPALRLNKIAHALGAPLDYFFEAARDHEPRTHTAKGSRPTARQANRDSDIACQTQELVDLFAELRSDESRAQLLKVVHFFVRDLKIG